MVIGPDTRIDGSPSEIVSARRSCCLRAAGRGSAPTTAGATGTSASRISSPSRPEHVEQQQVGDRCRRRRTCRGWRTPGRRRRCRTPGWCSSRAHTLTSGRLSTSSMTLPMYRLAISAHTSGPDSENSCGPGLQAVGLERGEDHRRRGRGGQADGQQRHQHARPRPRCSPPRGRRRPRSRRGRTPRGAWTAAAPRL